MLIICFDTSSVIWTERILRVPTIRNNNNDNDNTWWASCRGRGLMDVGYFGFRTEFSYRVRKMLISATGRASRRIRKIFPKPGR